MKLSIVIPVWKEKDTIKTILDLVKQANIGPNEKEIIIVDDYSTDGTREILKEIENNDPTIKIFYKSQNGGKGSAIREGFKHTTGDYVIVQDADLEYDPSDIIKLIRGLDELGADVVYGSRFSGVYEDMSNLHYFGNKLVTILTSILFGVLLTDMETCYKLLPGDFARKVEIKSQRFNFEPEITAKAIKAGLKIKEVPINYKGRKHSEGKKLHWTDGFSAVLTLIKYRFVN